MKIRHIMQKNPPFVHQDATFGDVVHLIADLNISSVPVLDGEGGLIGIVSRQKAFKCLAHTTPLDTSVTDIMSKNVVSVKTTDLVENLIEKSYSSLPVLCNNKLVGLVALTDTIKAYHALMNELRMIIETSYDGIFVCDAKGRITKTNTALKQILGIEASRDLTGNLLTSVIEELQGDCGAIFSGHGPFANTYVIRNTEVSITANPFFTESGKLGFVVINVRNLSNLRMLEQRIDSLNRYYSKEIVKANLPEGYIFASPKSKVLLDLALQVSKVDSTVLITGESGTGKEVICDLIYRYSDRHGKPLVKINCGAIPENLLESELFGYESGAFTGASKYGKAGFFETAEGGILFLDEIGEIPMSLQVKLLRAITAKEVQRLGGSVPRSADVRIIAATNRDLLAMVNEGNFRADLYYRLNVIGLEVAPLRERKEDILELSNLFFKRFNEKYHRSKMPGRGAMIAMFNYHWPGNIRELENIIERAVVTGMNDVIETLGLPGEAILQAQEGQGGSWRERVAEFERALLQDALKKYRTTRKIAENMGIDQSTIVKKATKLGVKLGR